MAKLNINKITEVSTVFTTLLLAALQMFPVEYSRIALVLYFVSVIADVFINKRWVDFQWGKSHLIFISMIIFYCLIWIWHPFSDTDIPYFKRESENMLPFLAFGLLGIISRVSPKLKVSHIAVSMSIVSVLCITIPLIQTLISIGIPDSINTYQIEFTKHRINTHMVFNLYLNINILFAGCAFFRTRNRTQKVGYFITIFFIYLAALTSEGRTGFFTSNILFIGFILTAIYKWKKKALFLSSVIALIGIGFLLSHHNRMEKSMKDSRIYIWQAAIETIKEKPILGHGCNDGRMVFIENGLNNKNFSRYYYSGVSKELKGEQKYYVHPHNAFLNTAISFGVIGTAVLCLIFLLPPLLLREKHRIYATLFLFIIGTQSMLDTFSGWGVPPTCFCLFLYLWILMRLDENGNDIKMI